MTGCLGKIYFLIYYIQYDEKNKEKYIIEIKKELDIFYLGISERSFSPFYVNGLAGFGYTLSLLNKKEILNIDEESFSDLDSTLWDYCLLLIENKNLDFFKGLIGIGNYYILRYPENESIKIKLKQIGGFVLSETLSQIEVIKKIEKYNLEFSLAHGLASNIIFIAKLIEMKVLDNEGGKLLESICFFLLSHINKSRLPDIIEDGNYIYSGLRWCHGELGIVYSLAFTSRVIKNDIIDQKSYEVALKISEMRDRFQNELYTACICHGTVGVAHIFNKLYNNFWTDKKIKDASQYWYNQSLIILKEKKNEKTSFTELDYENNLGILNGEEGIALGLISLQNSRYNDWDESILLFNNDQNHD